MTTSTKSYGKTATITVTGKSWDESKVATADDTRSVASATFTTEYAGDIAGESTCGMLLAYVGGDASEPKTLVAPFVGYEQVTGVLDGRQGTFVLATRGKHEDGVVRAEVEIVEGSGTGDLTGIRGAGSYTADGMEYTLTLDYDVD